MLEKKWPDKRAAARGGEAREVPAPTKALSSRRACRHWCLVVDSADSLEADFEPARAKRKGVFDYLSRIWKKGGVSVMLQKQCFRFLKKVWNGRYRPKGELICRQIGNAEFLDHIACRNPVVICRTKVLPLINWLDSPRPVKCASLICYKIVRGEGVCEFL